MFPSYLAVTCDAAIPYTYLMTWITAETNDEAPEPRRVTQPLGVLTWSRDLLTPRRNGQVTYRK